MIHTADWYVLFVFGCSLLGLFVSGVLFFANKNTSFSARMLAGFLTSLSLVGLNNALMATNFYSAMPHLWRVVAFASFLPAPFSFLYVRSVLNHEYRFRHYDWWFFVPSLLYILSMLHFFLQPSGVKMELINRIIANNNLIAQEPENLIPGGISTLARPLYGISTSLAITILLKRWKKRMAAAPANLAYNKNIYNWLVLFSAVVWCFYLLVFFVILSHINQWLHVWELVAFVISITVLFVCASLLARPSILYGMKGWLPAELAETANRQEASSLIGETKFQHAARKNTLTAEQGLQVKKTIENHLASNKPFLKPSYKLAELAIETDLPVYLVSAFINQEYGKNFSEFINDYRVDYLQQLLQTDHEMFAHYTLEALGKKAGFNSRNTFIASVKRKTGKTPSGFFGLKES